MPYLPALDGVRAIAVLLVLFSHFPYVASSSFSHSVWQVGQTLQLGYLGVNLFFVLSGFLITRILLSERYGATGEIDFRNFFLKRVLRIFPIYYLSIGFFILAFNWRGDDLFGLLTYTFNYYKPFQPEPIALEHAWSLSVEEQFYLLWPMLISVLPFRWGKRTTTFIIPALSVLTALGISTFVASELAARIIYMSTPTQMMALSLGASLAFRERSGIQLEAGRSFLVFGAGVAVLVLDSLGRAIHVVPAGGFYWSVALLGYAVICFGAVAFVVSLDNPIVDRLKKLLSLEPVRYVGRISYGLYLYHYVILFLFDLAPHETVSTGGSFLRVASAVLMTFLTAHLSYRYIECPILRVRNKIRAGRNLAPPVLIGRA